MDSASKITAWHSFRLQPARGTKKTVVGSYGGHPRGIRAQDWPRCAVCGTAMCHMAQIDAGPWLDLHGFARISVFICHATGGRCEDWDPWKGANRVLLHHTRDDNLYDGPPTVRVYRRLPLAVQEPFDELALMIKVKEDGAPVQEALEQIRHDKLGGGAVWLQGDDAPPCADGNGPMRLALQMTTNLISFDITPGGMAYVFVDPSSDEAVGRLLWQGV